MNDLICDRALSWVLGYGDAGSCLFYLLIVINCRDHGVWRGRVGDRNEERGESRRRSRREKRQQGRLCMGE